jgi:hypothetical protein
MAVSLLSTNVTGINHRSIGGATLTPPPVPMFHPSSTLAPNEQNAKETVWIADG